MPVSEAPPSELLAPIHFRLREEAVPAKPVGQMAIDTRDALSFWSYECLFGHLPGVAVLVQHGIWVRGGLEDVFCSFVDTHTVVSRDPVHEREGKAGTGVRARPCDSMAPQWGDYHMWGSLVLGLVLLSAVCTVGRLSNAYHTPMPCFVA